MNSTDKALPATVFPSLSTAYRSGVDRTPRLQENALSQSRVAHSVLELNSPVKHSRDVETLLRGYCRFIQALTGENEVAFRYAIRDAASSETTRGTAYANFSDSRHLDELDMIQNQESCELNDSNHADLQLDFGFEVFVQDDPQELELDLNTTVRAIPCQIVSEFIY
jgi:hypothetical protein